MGSIPSPVALAPWFGRRVPRTASVIPDRSGRAPRRGRIPSVTAASAGIRSA